MLPADQREAIKSYIVSVIVRYSSDEVTLLRTKMQLSKLNLILVQILKQVFLLLAFSLFLSFPPFLSSVGPLSRLSQQACNAPPARPSRPPELSCRHARDWARDLCARAQEWPHNWKDFIPQIVESGKTNETLCGNNMQILRLLSEEVFEFSLKQLTSKKIETLKESLTQEFQLIYQFCEFVMQVRCARESERASEAEREREREREITCV